MQVPRAPIPNIPSADFRVVRLRYKTSDIAAIELTPGGRLFFFTFLTAGIFFITIGLFVPDVFPEGWPTRLISCLVGSAALAVGLLGLRGRLVKKFTFDRCSGRMVSGTEKPNVFSNRAGTSLDNIAAVQICFDKRNDHSHQLNLVFGDPPHHRVNIISHNRETALRRDAQELATFLGIPFLDHSQVENE